MPSKVWGEITCPFPNFNDAIEVLEWISNFIPHYMMGLIIYRRFFAFRKEELKLPA